MSEFIVRNKEELQKAKQSKADLIIVKGDFAEKIKKTRKVAKAGPVVLGVLAAAIAATPFTGGVSTMAAFSVAGLTGLEIAAIIAVSSVGLALVLAVHKDYDEIAYDGANKKLTLKKKAS